MDDNIKKEVLEFLKHIPNNKVITYKRLGEKFGLNPRTVGRIVRENKDSSIPCHKVVKSDGSLGGFNRGRERKKYLLRKEGVCIKKGKIGKEFYWE